jgi:rod shape-determining protein MreC
VYDRKTVRRRRAVLGLLVACSLILLTASFGEGTGGALHAVQRGVANVLSPVESVATGALKPFRDLFGWVGDTFSAKKDNKALRSEVRELRAQNADLQDAAADGRALRKLFNLDGDIGIDGASQVTARVVFQSATVWYSTIKIDKGTADGVRDDQAVVDGDGLVGSVVDVGSNWAKVQLITDAQSGVTARVAGTGGANLITGTVSVGSPGNPKDLLLGFLVPRLARSIAVGDVVETSGIASSRFSSKFPRGIPIGRVSKVDENEIDTSQQVHVTPFASLRNLDYVQVITAPQA